MPAVPHDVLVALLGEARLAHGRPLRVLSVSRMAIPHVTHDQETIRLYASPQAIRPLFEMDPEQTRELIAMLAGSIASIEGGASRLTLLFNALLNRYTHQCMDDRNERCSPDHCVVVGCPHKED